jgi:hypothetical protein
MTIDQASTFFVGSILVCMGVTVLVVTAVVINNIIHAFWKSFGWKFFPAFIEKEPIVFEEPKLDKEKK